MGTTGRSRRRPRRWSVGVSVRSGIAGALAARAHGLFRREWPCHVLSGRSPHGTNLRRAVSPRTRSSISPASSPQARRPGTQGSARLSSRTPRPSEFRPARRWRTPADPRPRRAPGTTRQQPVEQHRPANASDARPGPRRPSTLAVPRRRARTCDGSRSLSRSLWPPAPASLCKRADDTGRPVGRHAPSPTTPAVQEVMEGERVTTASNEASGYGRASARPRSQERLARPRPLQLVAFKHGRDVQAGDVTAGLARCRDTRPGRATSSTPRGQRRRADQAEDVRRRAVCSDANGSARRVNW